MKFKLKTNDFSRVLSTVLPAVSTRSTLPNLSHFLIDAENKGLKVYATDLEIGIQASIKTETEKQGSATIPARNLTDIINVIGADDFILQEVSSSHFKISTPEQDTVFNVIGGKKDEFPVIPEVKEDKSVNISAEKLKEGMEKTISSVSRDESRYVLCGIFFESDGKELKMVSTDGRRLSFFKTEINGQGDEFKAIVPSKAVNVLERTLHDTDKKVKISLSSTDNQIYFSFDDTVIYSRIIEGDYPNYNQVIPDKPKNTITADTRQLMAATRKMMAVTTERSMAVKYSFSKNKAVISVKAPDTGSGTSTIPIEYNGDEIEIAFNPEYMINNLKVIKSEKIKLGLSTSINPGRIMPDSKDENYVGVIMPMRP